MDYTESKFSTQFSEAYLNLQKDFCCDSGSLKIIRWVGCKPGVYKGSKALFTSDDLSMCSWFQGIENYSFMTVDMEPNDVVELELKGIMFFLGKSTWEANSLNSSKHLEIGISQQSGVVGSTIPFIIGGAPSSTPVYNYQLIRDLYMINTSSIFDGNVKLNNCSPYKVSFSMLYAY